MGISKRKKISFSFENNVLEWVLYYLDVGISTIILHKDVNFHQ